MYNKLKFLKQLSRYRLPVIVIVIVSVVNYWLNYCPQDERSDIYLTTTPPAPEHLLERKNYKEKDQTKHQLITSENQQH